MLLGHPHGTEPQAPLGWAGWGAREQGRWGAGEMEELGRWGAGELGSRVGRKQGS